MANQAFRGRQKIIETDTETNLLDDFVGIFGIDVVFNGLGSVFAEIFWDDLDKVRDFCLYRCQWLVYERKAILKIVAHGLDLRE